MNTVMRAYMPLLVALALAGRGVAADEGSDDAGSETEAEACILMPLVTPGCIDYVNSCCDTFTAVGVCGLVISCFVQACFGGMAKGTVFLNPQGSPVMFRLFSLGVFVGLLVFGIAMVSTVGASSCTLFVIVDGNLDVLAGNVYAKMLGWVGAFWPFVSGVAVLSFSKKQGMVVRVTVATSTAASAGAATAGTPYVAYTEQAAPQPAMTYPQPAMPYAQPVPAAAASIYAPPAAAAYAPSAAVQTLAALKANVALAVARQDYAAAATLKSQIQAKTAELEGAKAAALAREDYAAAGLIADQLKA